MDGENQHFVSYTKPHDAVSKDTIARWIREVMCLAGADMSLFKAHSVRAASVSAEKANLAP